MTIKEDKNPLVYEIPTGKEYKTPYFRRMKWGIPRAGYLSTALIKLLGKQEETVTNYKKMPRWKLVCRFGQWEYFGKERPLDCVGTDGKIGKHDSR